MDRTTTDFDFVTGKVKITDGYIENLINETYIKNQVNDAYIKSKINKDYIKYSIVNEEWYKINKKFIGEVILRRLGYCWMNLEDISMIDKCCCDDSKICKLS